MTSWYCIYSTIGGEFDAWANLALRGFGVYLPLATRAGRKVPLMARYLFVEVQCGQLPCTDIRGVKEILPHEHDPQPVPTQEIKLLSAREAGGEFVFVATATGKKRERQVLRSLGELAIFRNEAKYACS